MKLHGKHAFPVRGILFGAALVLAGFHPALAADAPASPATSEEGVTRVLP